MNNDFLSADEWSNNISDRHNHGILKDHSAWKHTTTWHICLGIDDIRHSRGNSTNLGLWRSMWILSFVVNAYWSVLARNSFHTRQIAVRSRLDVDLCSSRRGRLLKQCPRRSYSAVVGTTVELKRGSNSAGSGESYKEGHSSFRSRTISCYGV